MVCHKVCCLLPSTSRLSNKGPADSCDPVKRGRLITRQKRDIETGLTDYSQTTLTWIAGFLSVIIAALLPTASILVLYFATKLVLRLCIVTAFSVIFSASLALFSKARKIEIFAATAAYVDDTFRWDDPVNLF